MRFVLALVPLSIGCAAPQPAARGAGGECSIAQPHWENAVVDEMRRQAP